MLATGVAFALSTGACSDGGATGADGAGGSAGAAGAAGAAGSTATFEPPEPPGVQVTTGAMEVTPGQDETICYFFDLPSDVPLDIVRLEQHNRGFVHHYVVHKAGMDFDSGTFGECPLSLYITHPAVYPGTRDQGPFTVPEGVALPLAAHEPMFIQVHLFNTSSETVKEELVINFHAGDPARSYERAGLIGGFDINFEIPPRQTYTETQQCEVYTDVNVFAMTSHSHGRTVSFEVDSIVDGVNTPIYQSRTWDSPVVSFYDPPLFIPTGGGFEFRCTWNNESELPIGYGNLATDEMCIFFGYYFPSESGAAPCLGL